MLLNRFRAACSRISEIEKQSAATPDFPQASPEPILRKILDLYEPLAGQGKVRLTLEMQRSPAIEGDGDLLFEAIGNLVDNAIKFTPPDGHISVTLEAIESGPIVSVIDTGPGIPMDQRSISSAALLSSQRHSQSAWQRAWPKPGRSHSPPARFCIDP